MDLHKKRQLIFFCMLCALCCVATTLKAETPLKILFIGNSFTIQGPIPTVVRNIALDADWMEPEVTNVAVNGQSLSYHRTGHTLTARLGRFGFEKT